MRNPDKTAIITRTGKPACEPPFPNALAVRSETLDDGASRHRRAEGAALAPALAELPPVPAAAVVALVLLSLGVTAVVFALTQLAPSNAVATNLGDQAAGDPAAVAAFKSHYGLDKPLPLRYAIYLEHPVDVAAYGTSAL